MGKGNSANARVMHKRQFPLYWLLYDHTKLIGCLCITNAKDQADLMNVVMMANDECKHDLPGLCAEIKPTRRKTWRKYH